MAELIWLVLLALAIVGFVLAAAVGVDLSKSNESKSGAKEQGRRRRR